MVKFKIVKSSSCLEMGLWEVNIKTGEVVNKASLEMSPAFPDNPKTQPKPGEKRYDYKKKIKISFNPTDMLKCAYHLKIIAFGGGSEFKKYGDKSKVAGSTSNEKVSLSIKNNDRGQAQVFLSSTLDNKNVSIYLDADETYALAKWFEATYNKLYNSTYENENVTEEE